MKKILAIIPARGGSKGIPLKNIRNFAGLPLLAHSIKTAKESKLINRVIVSTDSPEIAKIATKFGAEIPFLRPAKYARDDSLDLPVFLHALKWLKKNENYVPDIVVHLRPTSPIRSMSKVDSAIKLLINNKKADSVRGVIKSKQNPYKMWLINKTGFMKPVVEINKYKEAYNMPRQKLPETYWQTGYVDVIYTKTIVEKKSMSGAKIIPFLLDSNDWVDIDTLEDWKNAEKLIYSQKIEPKNNNL